ncbi:hypothetical protein O6H91_16G024300 [Diphasiastrum complanatum]|nr:hypothetical protein O6H91_16G024300 [Diphasiastrum complanatum]
MKLAPVPKMLALLRNHWSPLAFCVSFKLETDKDILLKKARSAREKYGMHAVVANELLTRKERVIVVTDDGEIALEKGKRYPDVEVPLVDFLLNMQTTYIQDSQPHSK